MTLSKWNSEFRRKR